MGGMDFKMNGMERFKESHWDVHLINHCFFVKVFNLNYEET